MTDLWQSVDAMRNRGLIVAPPARPQAARRNVVPMKPRTLALLDKAYRRRCFICAQRGDCGHREPEVELALLGVEAPVRY